ncbi:MAG: hypothetical protein KKE73_15530 [Proteobacteria bacterium]|nr:hypothetical protein [Pseudomonadota bacterium]
MTFKEIPPTPGTRKRTLPLEDLRSFVDDFPALLWRIEIAKSRIEFLNNHVIAPLGDGTRLVLQNAEYRSRILLPEDAPLMDSFLDAVKEGRTMASVFRVTGRDGELLWLKLTGAVNSSDPRFYYGYLLDIGDTAKVIQDILETESDDRLRMDNAPAPVLLAEFTSKRLQGANAAARKLFRLPKSLERGRHDLSTLLPRTMTHPLERVLGDLPQARSWEGTLEFKLPDGGTFTARTSLRYVSRRNTGLVRLALSAADLPKPLETAKQHKKTTHPDQALGSEQLLAAHDIPSLMQLVMTSPPMAQICDALMFSDIHARKNSVVVYGAGQPLEGMDDGGEEFSYQGTIAEDIVRFGLDHLEVEDTMDSIKPIDWALFIPRGIRSYYAKPYFERGTLRTVLILCSTKPNHFSGHNANAFDELLTPLTKTIRTLRRTLRHTPRGK